MNGIAVTEWTFQPVRDSKGARKIGAIWDEHILKRRSTLLKGVVIAS